MRRLVFAIVAASGVAATSEMVKAGDGCCYGGYFGYGIPGSIYVWEQIPYFAMNPPVYYSYPVPRPYGYSPFAYPPGTMTPEVTPPAAEPKAMLNPFVPGPTEAQPTTDKTALAPLRIKNPFVDQVTDPTLSESEPAPLAHVAQ